MNSRSIARKQRASMSNTLLCRSRASDAKHDPQLVRTRHWRFDEHSHKLTSLGITTFSLWLLWPHSPHPFPLVGRRLERRRAGQSSGPLVMLCSCRAGELCRKRGGRAGEGVEDEESQDRRQVQRSPERRDDAPEDVQVRVTYRAALQCHCCYIYSIHMSGNKPSFFLYHF